MKNVYIEKKIGFIRRFEIDDVKIHIIQKSILGPEEDVNIDLISLKSKPDTVIYKRNMPLISVLSYLSFFAVGSTTWNDTFWLNFSGLIFDSILVFFLVLTIIFLLPIKKTEYKIFCNRDELMIFEIGRFGKYKNEFDQYINLIINTINETSKRI